MDIKIEERSVGRVTILDIVGKLTVDQGAERLKDKINSLISQERPSMILNLATCPTSTAAGLASWWPRPDRS